MTAFENRDRYRNPVDLDDDDDEHAAGCSDYCDGSRDVDGGFATAPCLCWCHVRENGGTAG